MTKIFLGDSGLALQAILEAAFSRCLTNYTPNTSFEHWCDGFKGKLIVIAFCKVQIVQGELNDGETIAREVSDADVVVHLAAAGNLKSVETIHKALSSEAAAKPVHWIQLSGASVLAAAELADKTHCPGEASDIVFNDGPAGIEELRSFIQKHPSRVVDNYIIKVGESEPRINTALVFPPTIYGRGLGPVNQRSVQIPSLAKATLDRQRGVQVGKGLNRWGNLHIEDVSRLILRLVEKAAEVKSEEQVWNPNELYLAGVGETSFGEIAQLIATAAAEKGLIPTDKVDVIDPEEADSLLLYGTAIYGTNAHSEAIRGKEVLGWVPAGERLEDEIPKAVAREASVNQRNSP
ncbi:nucleoside-diphosphate-sugar epimerase [Colletotrichum graminicola]|uniref:Nucleoside-diphosphate-sugar epimerase n=1 Tax=Colletotrichum graminicola (strain M1.001 / M2 / FGSC 10212) TaxID=645133 RepID=E3QDN2_COLGM|nr:nucleoside-diphosphate-sugar epimerase [Colletotrichum graminicola M1.001]EFQ28970.1 nucleoside-diphosphate-sugar epimerase [Colletotrichum graminicola M1.001]WDK20023.1 nucleoside-diphosphate-sugar epimerase [Colletotrichum graminicola]